jgi:hypothetical protein
MPLKLNVSVSRKVGQPDYGSLGASCALELELNEGLLHSDLDGFQQQVRNAYVACNQAVSDELARHQASPVNPRTNGPGASASDHGPGNGNGPARPGANGSRGRSGKPATPSQAKAIYAIARSQRADLEGLLRDEYGVDRPEDLSLADASKFIDQLKAVGES